MVDGNEADRTHAVRLPATSDGTLDGDQRILGPVAELLMEANRES